MRRDDVKAMKEQRQQLVVELRSLNETAQEYATDHGGEWAAEDKDKFAKLEADILNLNHRLEMEYRTESAAKYDPADQIVLNTEGGAKSLEEYRSMHQSVRAPDMPDVRQAVYSWIVKGREGIDLDEFRVLSKAASGGGYLVPTDMAAEIVRALRFLPGGVTALAREIVTSTGDTFNVPLDLTHGSAAWIAESGSYTPSDETLTQAALSAYKAGTKIILSEELLTDAAFDLTAFLSREFGERIGALAEDAYINGNGTGKPTGLLDAGSGITVTTMATGQVTTTTYAELAKGIYSLPAQYRANASILASDGLWVRLITIVDSTGRPVWQPSVAAGAPDTFAGMPIYTHPGLPAIGASAKCMVVGDFGRGYWIRRVDSIYMQRQNELHSDSGQVGFRAYLRLDGKCVLADAFRIVAFAAT